MKDFDDPNNFIDRKKQLLITQAYDNYAILSVQRRKSLVSKSKETTRSHPEHGRKDLLQ